MDWPGTFALQFIPQILSPDRNRKGIRITDMIPPHCHKERESRMKIGLRCPYISDQKLNQKAIRSKSEAHHRIIEYLQLG